MKLSHYGIYIPPIIDNTKKKKKKKCDSSARIEKLVNTREPLETDQQYILAYLQDVVSLVPDHCSKAYIAIKQVT